MNPSTPPSPPFFKTSPALWIAAFAAVTLFILAFRLYTLWASPYLADNYYHLRDLQVLSPGTPLGPVMTGPPARVPGGLYYQMLRLGILMHPSPLGPKALAFLIGLLILAISVMWVFHRFGKAPALVTLAWMGVNPYLTIAAADFWNANFAILPALLATLLTLDVLTGKRNPRWALALAPLAAMGAQIHFAVLLVLPGALLLTLLFARPRTPGVLQWFFVGGLLAALLYVPYLAQEISTHFANSKAMWAAKSGARWVPPRADAIFLFPATEMGIFLGTGKMVKDFYLGHPLWHRFGIGLWALNFAGLLMVAAAWLYFLARLVPTLRGRAHHFLPVENPLVSHSVRFALSGLMVAFGAYALLRVRGDGFHYYYAILPGALIAVMGFFFALVQKWPRPMTGLLVALTLGSALQIAGLFYWYWQPLRYGAQQEMMREVVKRAPGGFTLVTRYEDASGSVYQKFGVPRFYEGTAQLMGLPWPETPGHPHAFLISAPDPSFRWPRGFPGPRVWKKIWHHGALELFESVAPNP